MRNQWRKWPYLSITCQLCGSAHVFFLYRGRKYLNPHQDQVAQLSSCARLSNFLSCHFLLFHVSPFFLFLLYHRRNMPTAYLRCLIKNTQPSFFVFFNWHSQIPTQSRRLLQLPANLFRIVCGMEGREALHFKIWFIYFSCASLAMSTGSRHVGFR